MRAPLWLRLFASYAVVVLVGVGIAYLTVRLLAPRLFDEQVHGPGMGAGRGGGPAVREAFRSALNRALLVAVAVSVALAGGVAALVSRRVVRPVEQVRAATRRVASGNYDVRVPASPVPELAGLAADVNRLAEELAETETRRTRLVGDVAHEMRTPLTALDGYVEGLVDGLFPADGTTLTPVAGELRRLHRLADDLAALSRAQEGRFDLAVAACELGELARHCRDRLAPQFADAGVDLQVVATEPVDAEADRQRIEQVLTNLLGNALRATPAGGVVTVTVGRDAGTARVVVSDTGIGLAADDLDRIFERFYRVPAAEERGGRGSGIGLTIARSIARAHGGDLVATSEGPGRGAALTLTLPAAR